MKTNYDKFIAEFVDTTFESTEGKEFEENGETWNVKQRNADIMFYLL